MGGGASQVMLVVLVPVQEVQETQAEQQRAGHD